MLERPAPNILLALMILLAAGQVTALVLGLGPLFPWKAVGLLVAGAVPLIIAARRHALGVFGHANRITLARAVLVALLFALWGERRGSDTAWLAIAAAVAALVLDGVDGWAARRRSEVSAFGARFDMEVDTLLILATAGLVWQFGKAGAWILLSGLLRYVFVAAGRAASWLRRPLPYRRRRQTVCVLHEVSLVVCLAPFLAPPVTSWLAFAGLVGLGASFAIDVGWLARHAGGRPGQAAAP